MNLLLAGLLAFLAPADDFDLDKIRERVKDPAQIFPLFQELIAAGEYSKAHNLLSVATKKSLPYEAFYIAFASVEPPRHMIASLRVHALDAALHRLKLCSREFGVSRDFRIEKFMTMYVLDFNSDDIEFLKGRTLGWYRLQVKRADGWHYAYPPDWTYAPLARSCGCGK